MYFSSKIRETQEFVKQKFSQKYDKVGERMYSHFIRVAFDVANHPNCSGEDEVLAALLHDIVEDTDETIESLRIRGYNDKVLRMVDLLTHDKTKMTYDEYIVRLIQSEHLGALRIKIADNHDNGCVDRWQSRDPSALHTRLMSRYPKYRVILENAERQIMMRKYGTTKLRRV